MPDEDDRFAPAGGTETGAGTDPLGETDTEVPGYVRWAFWKVTLLVNVGLLAIALGAMYVGFEGRWLRGGAGILVGLGVLGYAVVQYRWFRAYDRSRND